MIGCDIHPLNNLAPLQYLRRVLKHEQPEIDAWYHHWVVEGFTALETMIEPGPYCFGGNVTLADIYLVPQVYNARRLKVPLDAFPKLVAADAALHEAAGLRQGAAGKPARRRVTPSAVKAPLLNEASWPVNSAGSFMDDRRAAVVFGERAGDPRARPSSSPSSKS